MITAIIEGGKQTTRLAEELGFSAPEMAQLKKTGNLEGTVFNSSQKIANDSILLESKLKHDNARNILAQYAKTPISESDVRRYIHETGFPTFPKPIGIPENYLVMISEKGAGMMYVHPENIHISIRVMPGKSHSPHLHQQKPYVIQMESGKAIDKYGKRVPADSPEAHIPLEDYVYRH